MNSSNVIRIRRDNRVCFFGRVGSGKTTLARAYLRGITRFCVLDPKHTYKEAGIPIRESFNPRDQRQIIRPPFEAEDWESVLRAAIKKTNIVVYVDEITLVNEGYGAKLSPQLGRIIRTGRETNVAAWCGSQRPKDIPSAVFTESEHFFIFRLTWDEDRRKVTSFTTSAIRELLDGLGREEGDNGHEFVYYNALTEQIVRGRLDEGTTARR